MTLVELMIGMLLSSMTIAAVYSLLGSSAEVFHQQELTVDAQSRLRFVVNSLKQDLQLAGHHVSTNPATDPGVCPRPSEELRFISLEQKTLNVPGAIWNIEYDELTVAGDLSGHPGLRIAQLPDTSTIEVSLESLLRGQFQGYSASDAPALLERLISPGQWLAVTNPDQVTQYVQVSSVSGNALSISLTTPLVRASRGSSCGVTGLVDQMHEVHPIKAIRYSLQLDPNDADAQNTELVREEIDLSSGRPVNGTRLVIADYIVGLRFKVLGTDGAQSALAQENDDALISLDDSDDGPSLSIQTLESDPQRARFIIYRALARTSRAIPRRLALPDSALTADDAELNYYPLDASNVAEVRSLQGKLSLPTLLHTNPR